MTETKPPCLIAVMGLTGSGKSTFINLATQSEKKLIVGHSIRSCTDAVDVAEPFDLDGRRVVLFDTPGFDDTNKSETEILRIIAIELEKQYRNDVKLHGIIYVHRISDIRVGGLAKTNFGIFRKICGEKSLKNVVIVTNMWSKVSEEEGMRRVAELASLDDFFKPALEKHAVMKHHTRDTVESAHEIIRHILQNHPEPLVIQEELVDMKKDIDQTGAGMEVDKKVAALAAEYEKKLKEQMKAAEEARKERDEETRKEQLEEAEQVRKAIAKLEEDKANQANAYKTLQAQFVEAEERRRKEAAEHAHKLEEEKVKQANAYKALQAQLAEAEDKRRKEVAEQDRKALAQFAEAQAAEKARKLEEAEERRRKAAEKTHKLEEDKANRENAKTLQAQLRAQHQAQHQAQLQAQLAEVKERERKAVEKAYKLEEEKADQANAYKALQAQFAETEDKRRKEVAEQIQRALAQFNYEAEERRRKEAAAKAKRGWFDWVWGS